MHKTIYVPLFVILFTISACTQATAGVSSPTPSGGLDGTPAASSPTPSNGHQGTPVNSTPIPSSGIEGYATEGPMCPGPVQIGNNTCPNKPYQATITVLDASNRQITQFQTDTNGYFKIYLAPGSYVLQPEPGNPLPHAADQSVVVTDGQYTQVTIIYDTGMR